MAKIKSPAFETLCKRTDYPKLGYIIFRLKAAKIPCRFKFENGQEIHSFHADHILEVASDRAQEAWDLLGKRFTRSGRPSKTGAVTLDDLENDLPCFDRFTNEKPE